MRAWVRGYSQYGLRVCVASFPDSIPQLFIAPCIKAGEWSLGTRLDESLGSRL